MGARNRVGIGLSYRPAMLHRLTEVIPWNLFLGFMNIEKYGLLLDRLAESIPWNQFLSRNLKSRSGARNQFQEPSLELSSQAT
jgi:hypothetical protein